MKNKLVPIEPTEEMIRAFYHHGAVKASISDASGAYKAMLAAAPDVDIGTLLKEISDVPPYQDRVATWMQDTFGPVIAADQKERNHRFLEEALELVQSLGCTEAEAFQLVAYVFNRPAGEPSQEVGGTMVTLAALCQAAGIQMYEAANIELHRVSEPDVQERIRAKQAAKPAFSPLPETTDLSATLAKLTNLLGQNSVNDDLREVLHSCLSDFKYIASVTTRDDLKAWLQYRAAVLDKVLNGKAGA